jgi:CRP-like cAMP-binding protein
VSHLEVLQKAQLLQGLSTSQLKALLAANPIITFQRDQVVFEENSDGREIYVVLEGEVAVEVDPAKLGGIERGATEVRRIRTFGPGESFGEIAVVDHHPREAAIVATQDNTRLLVIPPHIFDNVVQAQTILHNITRDLSEKVRGSNVRLIQSMLSGYYLTALVEGLATDAYDCNPIIPLPKLVVIRNAESFILSGPGRFLPDMPEQEAIEISFFSEPAILQKLVGPGEPSGAVAFNALFSIIRSGHISERIAGASFHYELNAGADRRSGQLILYKTNGGEPQPFTLEWQVKGARYNPATRTASAYLFLYIYTDPAQSTHSQAQEMIANIAMPVQRYIYDTLPAKNAGDKVRLLIIHHRSHETAHTLRTVQKLGYQIDSFIGIPYGDVNWDYITMLDHASNHTFMSLKLITHPTEPTRYQFDFRQSSFLDTQTEQDILALYNDPAISGDYLAAMYALAEYRLARAVETCRSRGERLMVYEDGGYIVSRIYDIYKNSGHRYHALIKAAVDDGLIIGVVEVTVAGERKNQQMMAENKGQALLPVLSNARSDIKAVYEAMGVAEAVIHASATSFGRLGLPTFQTRRVAVIGGNGAIGTRVVEQLTALHNSAANVFAVSSKSSQPFSLEIDRQNLPYAAIRLKYRQLPRYVVGDNCWPVILDHPYTDPTFEADQPAIAAAIRAFLAQPGDYDETAITNSYPLAAAESKEWWQEVTQSSGYRLLDMAPLPTSPGWRVQLQRDNGVKTITLLGPSTILTFREVADLLRWGVDTIIGSTGLPVFSGRDLDVFLARPNPANRADDLTLISASSKDYEFRQAIDFLNILLKVQVNAPAPAETRLGWFAGLYKDEVSLLRGEDFAPLQSLFAAPVTDESLQAFCQAAPEVAAAVGLNDGNPAAWRDQLADFIANKIRNRVSIRKEIRPDIGSIYHLTVNGQAKRVVLLADGLVVNFFARHEKGVKTEYIDPIVTMQLLSLVKLATTPITPDLYKMDVHLRPEDMAVFWAAINDYCRPLALR